MKYLVQVEVPIDYFDRPKISDTDIDSAIFIINEELGSAMRKETLDLPPIHVYRIPEVAW